jgi:hypothetical protein
MAKNARRDSATAACRQAYQNGRRSYEHQQTSFRTVRDHLFRFVRDQFSSEWLGDGHLLLALSASCESVPSSVVDDMVNLLMPSRVLRLRSPIDIAIVTFVAFALVK